MPKVKHKNSTTTTNVPAAGSLEQGELAVNITDQKLWAGDAAGDPVLIADLNAAGGEPNVDADSISFGGAYKIEYNSGNNTLDIVYIGV